MPSSYPDIAERFKQFVKSTGLTYRELADQIGTTFETLQSYSHGRSSPNFYTLRQLKKKFGLDYDWLIDGTSKKPKRKSLSTKIQAIRELLIEMEGA